jgi:hypothetical protein
MKRHYKHQIHALLTMVISVVTGVLLIPFLRSNPESIHTFVTSLHDWQICLVIFSLCVIYTYLMFRLFSPKLAHLDHLTAVFPTWLAWLIGIFIVAIIDLWSGLGPCGYQGNFIEWIGYTMGSILLVGSYSGTWSGLGIPKERSKSKEHDRSHDPSLKPVKNPKWEDIEDWLKSDVTGKYDFFEHHEIAKRLSQKLMENSHSIGLLGPFGAGKSSIVQWIVEELENTDAASKRQIICTHSCWGFKDSSSSIHEMLSEAIKKLELEIDVFQVRSLPESYRQTFASAGNFIDVISRLVFGERELSDQFHALDNLLSVINARLVFIVEDLDRNKSRTFDIQEVVAFLQQLKDYDNFSIILAGGSSSSEQIDFVKLCDHIEDIEPVEARHITMLEKQLQEHCIDSSEAILSEPFSTPDKRYVKSLITEVFMGLSFSQAMAFLLNTPRLVKHCFRRTYYAWGHLRDEINFEHLLAINVLRFGAPEALDFMIRRWDRLHTVPPEIKDSVIGQRNNMKELIRLDWESTTQNVRWDKKAAFVVMDSMLPTIECWLTDSSSPKSMDPAKQGVQKERYWRRAIYEFISPDEIKDQTIINEMDQWIESPNCNAEFIINLISDPLYSEAWEDLSEEFFNLEPDKVLILCGNILDRILQYEGPEANFRSQGFIIARDYAMKRNVIRHEHQKWLENRILNASSKSISFVFSLVQCFVRTDFLFENSMDSVREYVIEIFKSQLEDDGNNLAQIIGTHPENLYKLIAIRNNGEHIDEKALSEWSWMGPVLLTALRQKNEHVVTNIANLVVKRDPQSPQHKWKVDEDVFFTFFPREDTQEVLDLFEESLENIQNNDQQELIQAVVKTTREAIQQGESLNKDDDSQETD